MTSPRGQLGLRPISGLQSGTTHSTVRETNFKNFLIYHAIFVAYQRKEYHIVLQFNGSYVRTREKVK